MFSLLISAAFALDCTDRHAETCDAVNELTTMVNDAYGEDVVADDGVPTRLLTSRIYDQLDAIRERALDKGCRVDDIGFDGFAGGAYTAGVATPFSGQTTLIGGVATTIDGTLDSSDKSLAGTDGDGAVLGDDFGSYGRQGQLLADQDKTDFFAGRWIRVRGARGVFVALHGTCDGSVAGRTAFSGWFDGDLAIPEQERASYLPLDGDLLDASGTSNDGIFEGSGVGDGEPSFIADATHGTVMDFNGSNDRVFLGDFLPMGGASWAVSLWVKTPPTESRVPLVGYNDGDNGFQHSERDIEISGDGTWGQLSSRADSGNLVLNAHSHGGTITTQSAIELDDDTWHMITVVHDHDESDTAHELYIDGVLQERTRTMENGDTDIGDLYLGFANASGNGNGGYLDGQMAKVSLYDRAIDAWEVAAMFAE